MANVTGDSTSSASPPSGTDDTWPPTFPHRNIDALLTRLKEADRLEVGEAALLLGMVAKEAERLRGTVVRLSTAKLSEADREARAMIDDAASKADSLKSIGMAVLDQRLDEAERLISAMREAFRVELRAAQLAAEAATRSAPVTRLRRYRETDEDHQDAHDGADGSADDRGPS